MIIIIAIILITSSPLPPTVTTTNTTPITTKMSRVILSSPNSGDISVPIQPKVFLDVSTTINPLSYFYFQPVLHGWCNKGCGMCYPVCGMMHIKEPLLLIGKSSPCGSSRFSASKSEWSFTIYMTPYNRK